MFRIVSTDKCIYCQKAKDLLTEIGISYVEDVLNTPEKRAAFRNAGFSTVPQIYKDGLLIGGFDNLQQFIKERIYGCT